MRYVRDMRGYGANPPDPKWPGGAHVAVQFVVNYEEGGENCVLHGDAASEAFLSEIVGAAPWPGMRHWNMELIYEYGARAGFWRLHRMFTEADVPVTVLRRRHRACPLARPGRGHAGGRLGDRLARAEVDRLPRPCAEDERARHRRGDPPAHGSDRRAPDRLVHRPHLGQHGAAGRRGRRLRLCLRHL